MKNPTLLLLGKLPPPFYGPALATQILIKSELKNRFKIIHLNTNVHETLLTMGAINLKKIYQNINLYIQLIRLIVQHKPDVALIPISQSTLGFVKDAPFIIISRLLSVRTIVQVRGSNIKNWLRKSSLLTRWFFKVVVSSCQSAIVLGSNLKFLFADYFEDEKIFVVPNGGNYPLPDLDEKVFNNNILFFANLQSSKGIEDFIKSLVFLKEKYTQEFFVNIVGQWRDEETKKNCINIIEKHSLPVKTFSPKYGDEKFNFFKEADIFVFPPRLPEGHPWVIIEAMAFGLPIITTDQGAIKESVIDGENGFIIEKNNPQQIAEKLFLLLSNPQIAKQMGIKGQQYYLEKFTEDKMVYNLSNALYKTILLS